MGTYLSTPVKEKSQEEGICVKDDGSGGGAIVIPTAWGVVDMQGWRKSMEDAHVARSFAFAEDHSKDNNKQNDNSNNNNVVRCFGVFDGHGGAEVARFCALYLVAVWRREMEQLLQQQQQQKNENNNSKDNDDDDIDVDHCGEALKRTFHGLDRLIDDPLRRDELVRLRAIAPEPGEQRDLDDGVVVTAAAAAAVVDCNSNEDVDDPPPATSPMPVHSVTPPPKDINKDDNNAAEMEVVPKTPQPDDKEEMALSAPVTPDISGTRSAEDSTISDEDTEEADSVEAAGVDEAAELDQDLSSDEEDDLEDAAAADDDTETPPSTLVENGTADIITTKESDKTDDEVLENGDGDNEKEKEKLVAGMFQRLLNLSGSSGQVVLHVGKNNSVAAPDTMATSSPSPSSSYNVSANAQSPPTLVRNGQLFCNLPDHPIHAGATAIVAVLRGRTLTVANAGDSRAVLCRANGETKALSSDHKPMQPGELNRIKAAGGFVNSFGRVNGNLNLSRSIGDLKYKQVTALPPEEQMITAEPDIVQVTLEDTDEFIILGCDGIWDCLTNEKAVEFVRERIDTKKPTEIGVEMLDTIISDDPRASQGIGGDNMTIMIVDLQPQTRTYRREELN